MHTFREQGDDTPVALVPPRNEGLLQRRLEQADFVVIQHAQGDRQGKPGRLGSLIGSVKVTG
ncbi:hypothetical protein ACFVQ4_15735 [Streptomyces laurentii]|uniref:hypothetical protein n=1 Tax=Streptomyces laurentii TaxID=39478 RepID=UPI0036CD5781